VLAPRISLATNLMAQLTSSSIQAGPFSRILTLFSNYFRMLSSNATDWGCKTTFADLALDVIPDEPCRTTRGRPAPHSTL
jgi:hypothetical protein